MNIRLFLNKWHRRFGIISSLFVILLVITGLLLNHTSEFKLAERFVNNEFFLDAYNIQIPDAIVSYAAGDSRVTLIGKQLYFNEQHLDLEPGSLYGIVVLEDETLLAAVDGKLISFSNTGEIIEILSAAEGVPSGIKAIGVSQSGDIVIDAAHGFYTVDIEHLDWQELDHLEANWSQLSEIEPELLKVLKTQYLGRGLSLERVLLDMHSGRLLGKWGVFLVDLMAILFLLLAVSGLYMWFRKY